MGLLAIHGLDYDGGHPETKGVSPAGQVVTVPRHEHRVSLDFTHIELDLRYAFAQRREAWLRLPYEIKSQRADLRIPSGATPAEVDAITRNRDLHHRSDTYEGPADLMLLVARRRSGVFTTGDALTLALGSSLPTGQTERDPMLAGRRGQRHLHIQFGTGTFDPLLEGYYHVPLSAQWHLSPFATGRLPFYENRKTYRGSIQVSAGLSLLRRLNERWSLSLNQVSYFQDYAHWAGTRDPNTGLLAHSAGGGVNLKIGERSLLNLGLRQTYAQRALSSDSDAFEQGPVLELGWTTSF